MKSGTFWEVEIDVDYYYRKTTYQMKYFEGWLIKAGSVMLSYANVKTFLHEVTCSWYTPLYERKDFGVFWNQ